MTTLITAANLKSQLGKNMIVFDCRFRLSDPNWGGEAYRSGHIPGAYHLDLNLDLSGVPGVHGGRHPLPDWQALVAKLNQAGVSQHSHIVLYDDSRFAFAARAWWLLQQLGCSNLSLLDGGYQAWLDSGGAQDRRAAPARTGNLCLTTLNHRWITREQLLAAPSAFTLIDAREAARYEGKEEPIDPVAGHIPGAINVPWQQLTTPEGIAKPLAEQQTHWNPLPEDKPLVIYCGSGVTACVNLLSLQLCDRQALLYPGSWSDWCSYPDHPRATGRE